MSTNKSVVHEFRVPGRPGN